MEALPIPTPEDNTGANVSNVKNDDSSPRPGSGRGSPPPNCAICLEPCRNKSFTDCCLHQFCFKCLLTWSKVKAECPLCKQNFKSIIHNVRSNTQYEEYMVEQHETGETTDSMHDYIPSTSSRRFRFQTTLTIPRRGTMAIQQLLLHYPLTGDIYQSSTTGISPHLRRRSALMFRRTVYRHNLWARPLPDLTGQYRDCTPDCFRFSYAIQRLEPWINRELQYLLNENVGHIEYVQRHILDLLPRYHINSNDFKEAVQRYFGDRTEHFLHELYCFAATPFDIIGYDQAVQYTTDSRISTMINEVISSSDSDASIDSDIVMVTTSEPADLTPGTSRIPEYPQNYISQPSTNVIPIETISHSDTDDDSSEVMVVGYIKPPQDRTPEVVDLLGSDSDVIVQDNVQPECSHSRQTDIETNNSLVKLSLKPHVPTIKSDSDDNSYRPSDDNSYSPPGPRKRRRNTNDTATTKDTYRSTVSSVNTFTNSGNFWSPTYETDSSNTSSYESNDTSTELDTNTSSSSTSSNHRRKRKIKKKRKKSDRKVRSSKRTSDAKIRKTSRKRNSHSSRKRSRTTSIANSESHTDKRKKNKSRSEKEVKTTKRSEIRQDQIMNDDQPSTSGLHRTKHLSQDDGRKSRRRNREYKRLKSVVNVMNNQINTDSTSSGNSCLLNPVNSAINNLRSAYNSGSASYPAEERTSVVPNENLENASPCIDFDLSHIPIPHIEEDSDSEDNLPLNLTIKRSQASTSSSS